MSRIDLIAETVDFLNRGKELLTESSWKKVKNKGNWDGKSQKSLKVGMWVVTRKTAIGKMGGFHNAVDAQLTDMRVSRHPVTDERDGRDYRMDSEWNGSHSASYNNFLTTQGQKVFEKGRFGEPDFGEHMSPKTKKRFLKQ
jgi:hypothetical protein